MPSVQHLTPTYDQNTSSVWAVDLPFLHCWQSAGTEDAVQVDVSLIWSRAQESPARLIQSLTDTSCIFTRWTLGFDNLRMRTVCEFVYRLYIQPNINLPLTYSSSSVMQVWGSPGILKWFQKTLFSPSMCSVHANEFSLAAAETTSASNQSQDALIWQNTFYVEESCGS